MIAIVVGQRGGPALTVTTVASTGRDVAACTIDLARVTNIKGTVSVNVDACI